MSPHKQETEIKLRSRGRRLALNIVLIVAFLAAAGWLLAGMIADGREMKLLDEQIPILEYEVKVKERDFLTQQALHDQTVKRMTPAEQVQKSLELQNMREMLEKSRNLLNSKKERNEEVTSDRTRRTIYLIIGAIVLLVALWINYILEY
jgi:hypothetical protein